MTEPAPKVVLVHISDIHFMKETGAGEGVLDEDVRRELKRDLGILVPTTGAAHAILVGGDIAYSGKVEEYKRAETWLAELRETSGCAEENVWMVCGNHDMQREVIDSSKMLRHFQKQVRECAPDKVDEQFGEYLRDSGGRVALFAALENYNRFASKYGGHFSHEQLVWDKSVVLNDGTKLWVRGLNSALGSNRDDHPERGKLSLGSGRCNLVRQDGYEYLVLCHHPPEWLRDADDVLRYLDSRARLQLFGHKHQLRVLKSTTNNFDCLKVHAGAVNPERDGVAMPRYNVLSLHVDRDLAAKKRTLVVELHPRIWHPDSTQFVADTATCVDGKPSVVYQLSLAWLEPNQLQQSAPVAPIAEVISQPQVNNPLNVLVPSDPPVPVMQASWRLSYHFLSLPFHQRMEVASDLHLLEDGDNQVEDAELFKRFFRRAAERKILREFYEAVEKKFTGQSPPTNPFS